jgi:hypothetical protein
VATSIVSEPNPISCNMSVASSAFTSARLPEMVSVVPDSVTPATVAESNPVESLSTTVMVSPAASASASATLIPGMGVAIPCWTS